MPSKSIRADYWGIFMSVLCAIHCMLTPILFLSSPLLVHHAELPWYWSILDIVFLAFSAWAIRNSTLNISKKWVKYVFWSLWVVLALSIFQEKLELELWSDTVMYVITFSLIALHIYNIFFVKK